MTISIYGLFHPNDLTVVRYVGKTKSPLSQRLSTHLRDARSGMVSHRCHWIRCLIDDGLAPVILLLEEAKDDTWEECERRLIAQHKSTITNATDGGTGVHRTTTPLLYSVYLSTLDGVASAQTFTNNREEATLAFAALVNRLDLDGAEIIAEIKHISTTLAHHRFDRPQGDSLYWRNRIDDIQWIDCRRSGPAPSSVNPRMRATAVTMYDWEIAGAKALGKGNFSLGVRKALKRAGVKPPAAVEAVSPVADSVTK